MTVNERIILIYRFFGENLRVKLNKWQYTGLVKIMTAKITFGHS